MQIKVRTLNGNTVDLEAEETDKVVHLKEQLQEKQGIEKPQIKLIYRGTAINDDKTLKEAGITGGCMLHMVLNLKGGKY